ncbi:MAG: peptidoglycan DD-metalloendopeptidase family protein [Actinomycetia bacterium]|nr:peptidoglycan DD-metalloendopeptidase family protein [Actinomycetes bacterium]
MRTPFHLRVLVPVLVLGLLALVPVTASAQTETDVENAKTAEDDAFAALIAVDQKLEDELYELEDIDGQIYNLEWRISKLETALSEYAGNVDSLEDRAKLIVYEAYTSGGRNMVTTAFSANDIQDLITSQALFDAATTRDLAQLDQLAAVGRQMDRLNEDLGVKEAEVQELRSEQQTLISHLEEDRAAADKLHEDAKTKYADTYKKYKEEQARIAAEKAAAAARAAAAAAAKAAAAASRSSSSSSGGSSGGAAGVPAATVGVNCPLPNGSSFIDTWGYARSQGRTHKGTDMIASRGSIIVAMRAGTVRMNWHSLGGRQVYVNGTDGITYYYAHLSGYPSGLSNGQRVSQGQVIGYVGSTGNATTNVLHLGMIVGGRYVNPYPTVRRAC